MQKKKKRKKNHTRVAIPELGGMPPWMDHLERRRKINYFIILEK